MFVNFENPKIIYKRFNGVHMCLRNYSANISEKLMVVSFIVLRITVEIWIYFWVKGQSSWKGHVFFSAIYILPRPQGNSNNKNIDSPLPVKTMTKAFAIILQKSMDMCAYIPRNALLV